MTSGSMCRTPTEVETMTGKTTIMTHRTTMGTSP